jgi:hypothetical protein
VRLEDWAVWWHMNHCMSPARRVRGWAEVDELHRSDDRESAKGLDALVDAHTEAAVQGKEAAMLRAYHVTLDSLGAPADEWPCNRVAALVKGKNYEIEVLDMRRSVLSNMLRYIAFVLAGDETADSQLAADRAKTQIDDLTARLAAAEGENRDLAKKFVDMKSYADCVEIQRDALRAERARGRAVP